MNNTTTPQDVGMSADQLERAFGQLTAATEAGQIGAASLTVTRHGKEVFARGCGQQHPRTRQPVDADSIFLLASITKPVTACALMILVDRGLISLNDPAIDYLPEYTGGDRPAVKVRHLLSHISGMPDMLPENTILRQAHTPVAGFVERALQTPLALQTGNRFLLPEHGHPARSRNSRTSQRAAIARLRARGNFRAAGNGAKRIGNGQMATSGRSVVRHGRRRG